MIRTVWLAIACLIGLAALTVIRVGTASLEATGPSDQTTGLSPVADASLSNPLTLGTLPKGDRLDVADADDAIKPVRPIAILPKVTEALPVETETSEPERSWRSSYAKRQAGDKRHRKGKYHTGSRRHRSYHAHGGHGASKHMTVRKKKSHRR